MMRNLSLPLLLLFLTACKQTPSSTEQNGVEETEVQAVAPVQADTSIHYTYKVFAIPPSENNADAGYGFEISSTQPGGMHIRQANIPAVQGNHPFLSEENAAATAQLMIYKLTHGISPPAVSVEELDSLGVVY